MADSLGMAYEIWGYTCLQAIHVLGQLRFQIGSLVLVDQIVLGKLIQHAYHFWILFGGGFFFRGIAKRFNGIPGGTGTVLVSYPFFLGLPDPFLR